MDRSSPKIVVKRPSLRRLWGPIVGIGLTQMIGWGTSFTALTVLGTQIARDLSMAREAVFGSLSIMLLVSAVVAPRVGRFIDAEGARDLMLPGTLVGAVSLLVVAVSQGPWSFWFGWALFGLTVAMMLNNAAAPALVQIAGTDSRRAVSAYTIVTGVTSAIFLPLTEWLASRYGWRHTMLIFSLMYIVICLPVLLAVLPKVKPERPIAGSAGGEFVSWDGVLPTTWRRTGFWLVALWMAMQGLMAWGFNVQVVDILTGGGLSRDQAIAVWMLSGPSQAVARLGDLASGGKSGILRMALLASAAAVIGFTGGLMFGVSTWTASALAVCFGVSQGLYAVARSLLPLRLFGLRTFGTTMGYLALPLNVVSALAPLAFSSILVNAGPMAAFSVAAGAGVVSLVALVVLDRLITAVGKDETADAEKS